MTGIGQEKDGENQPMDRRNRMFGKLAETLSWASAGYLLIPVCAIGMTAIGLTKVR